LEITVLSDKQNKDSVRGLVGFTEFSVTNKTELGKRFLLGSQKIFGSEGCGFEWSSDKFHFDTVVRKA